MYSYIHYRTKHLCMTKSWATTIRTPIEDFGRLSRTAWHRASIENSEVQRHSTSVAGARRRVCAHCALVGPVHRHPCTPLYTVHTHSEDEKMCRIFSTKTVRMRVYVYILDDDICSFRPRRAPQCWRVSSPRLGRASSAGSRVPVTRLVEHRSRDHGNGGTSEPGCWWAGLGRHASSSSGVSALPALPCERSDSGAGWLLCRVARAD